MMASTHEQTTAHAGGTSTALRAPANGRLNGVLAASNDAVVTSDDRPLVHANRARKRSHDDTGGALPTTDTHGGTRILERDKRARVESIGGTGEAFDVTKQLTRLGHQNEQLTGEMAALKDDLFQRNKAMDRFVGKFGSLEQVEREMQSLQAKYDECTRKDLAVIQDTKQRVSDVLNKLDQLQRAGNLTAHELQAFRQDYNRQIDAVLAKVDALASVTSQRTALNVDAVTAEEIHQLRDELAICKDELTEMEPRRASVENEFFQRMERFSNQLDHVRLQMSKMEQDLLQENAVSRRSLENLLSRQMTQHRHAQAAENKRLREEMDELRSDMCELLKEMHLLKERTKYLGREPTRRGAGPSRSPSLSFPRYTSSDLHHAAPTSSTLYAPNCTSYLYAPPSQTRVPVHGDDELYCQHHHCPAGIPHGHAGVAHGPPIKARSPSPPRLTQSALLQASQAAPRLAVPVADHHDLPRFCPSPHYSSRSSSVSGRISATRDEHAQADDGHVDDKELERRLLEKHRLFWISEGAGSVSQASLEPPTPKFPDEV